MIAQKRFGDVEDGSELRSVRKRLVEEGGKVMERSVPLPEILSALTPTSIPIILLDMNAITGPSGVEYQGHFVPIIGFCEEGVIIHNQGSVAIEALLHARGHDTSLPCLPLSLSLFFLACSLCFRHIQP